jgi:hypothetical protein
MDAATITAWAVLLTAIVGLLAELHRWCKRGDDENRES